MLKQGKASFMDTVEDIKDDVVTTTTDEQQIDKDEKWDKEKQRADQAEANYHKISERFNELKDGYENSLTAVNELRTEITSLKELKKEVKEEISELDDAAADPTVIRYIKRLNDQIKKAQLDLAIASGKIAQYEQTESQKEEEQRIEKAKEDILSVCDELHGAKYRSKANLMADKLVNDGLEPRPLTAPRAIALLSKCYKKVKTEEEEAGKKTVKQTSTDTGQGGVSFDFGEDIKDGSLQDVLAQMKKKIK